MSGKQHATVWAAMLLSFILAASGCGAGGRAERSASSSAPATSAGSNAVPDVSPGDITEPAPKPSGESFREERASGSTEGYGDITDDIIDIAPAPDGWEGGPSEGKSGILTAGEWSDNGDWDFFQTVLKNAPGWDLYQQSWNMWPSERITARVRSGQEPVPNAAVTLLDVQGNVLWNAVTDNKGNAYLFYGIFGNQQAQPASIKVTAGQLNAEQPVGAQDVAAVFNLEQAQPPRKSLDLMLVFDTTGSMGDELSYLQEELQNVVEQVRWNNANIPTRLSVNFYRDHGDAYIVRPFPFTDEIPKAVKQLRQQSANGGGDYPEAVEMALENAVYDHDWATDSTKLLFLILDAPPHREQAVIHSLQNAIDRASQMGIRIIPIASSGIDKETEFLLRTIAASTGGTYVFLTDDSGVGNSHIEPTIGNYTVQKLNKLLVEIIGRYIA